MLSAGTRVRRVTGIVAGALVVLPSLAFSQTPNRPRPSVAPAPDAQAAVAAPAPADYVIGPSDILSIVFWREKDLSVEVVVRPDGKISLPLLNDVQAAGLTPEQMRRKLAEAAKKYLEDPIVTVVVKQINNNRVFITGQVVHPGPYPLAGPTTVLQLIAMAGGVSEFADRKHVLVTRVERGQTQSFEFNYEDVIKRKNLEQNIVLKPGDTVVVP